jgi:broad specificity phosphatase PhoE
MQLYIIRHGEPAYPADALTPRGHREAQLLACRLTRLGASAIFSSPMQRALATAQYTATRLALPIMIEPWMQELENWTIAQAALAEFPAWGVDPQTVRQRDVQRQNWALLPPFTADLRAKFDELQRHSDVFLSRHGYTRTDGRYRIERPNQQRLAVFCHCGFGLTWLAHLLEIPVPMVWAGFTLQPSSLTTIVFEEEGGQWAVPRCLGLGDLSHLAMAPL